MNKDGKPHYSGHRIRLKNRFKDNPASLGDYELIELLLGYAIPRRDVKPIAKKLLAKAGSFWEVMTLKTDDIEGAGEQTEIFFAALREFYCRMEISSVKTSGSMGGAKDVYNYFKYDISMSSKENLAAVFLNAKNAVIDHKIVSVGTVNSAVVFPREIAEASVKAGAVNVILCHNHPSGDPSPSPEDLDFTFKIQKALATLGIGLLDHVIVSKTSYVSLKDGGYL